MIDLGTFAARIRDPAFLPPEIRGKGEALSRLLALFCDRFDTGRSGGGSRRVFSAHVPGRIEVLGKHTDYAGGHGLVAALDRGFMVLAAANDLERVRIVETSREFEALDFPVAADLHSNEGGGWSHYPMTAIRRLASNFANRPLRGMDVAISSDLPVGSGMSGSSAIIILAFAAFAAVNDLRADPRFRLEVKDGIDLAMYLAAVENGQTFRSLVGGVGVGTFGGSEDHTAIVNAKSGCLSLYRFAPTLWKADIPWPDAWALAVCFSGVRAEKTREARDRYNLLSHRARAVVDTWNRETGSRCATLREVVDAAFADSSAPDPLPEAARILSAGGDYPDDPWDLPGRLLQFRLEDRSHIPAAVGALRAGDGRAFGAVVSESHKASVRYLGNIASEIDVLCEQARDLGAWGASGFGAGFGGSAYAVLPANGAEQFLESWSVGYGKRYPALRDPSWFALSRPAAGVLDLSQDPPARWVDGLWK
jgi:galactokinase